MPLEIEVKYLNPNLQSVCERLVDARATFCANHFEENWLFDTPDRRLRAANTLLRLRQADGATLTAKKKPDASQAFEARFKVLEELETKVDDPKSMRIILEMLGYVIVFRYEKIRATWQWQSCTICLDTLPFTQVVELEGTPESIELTARRLGLDKLEPSTGNYVQLYKDHCQALGVSEQDRFLFSETQRTAAKAAMREAGNDPTPYAVFLRPDFPGA
ncbi:class IV adenylate cyclase [Desulfonatronum sp. SC1]|uniref:class IV adenylate cyclase n=1 Tax=Desulfonatronum sp. SC1 TaxID=2109626 RepID=UPI000D2F78B1|nr:class IV adenylate cyclase [Desulfonatronum sp. SC1]PTN38274.1 adenylate cyclase [Desulfonatronum sp. SC1]